MKKNICLIVLLILTFCLFGCGDKQQQKSGFEPNATEQQKIEPEPNTSEMVDSIILKAKEDAETATEEQKNEALAFINDNIDDYFKDNKTMEKVIYYGALLDYCYDDSTVMSKIGTDAIQVVKYVYRGYDTIEAVSTQENLKQIREGLEKLNQ